MSDNKQRLRQALRQYSRNFRWGTCGWCPRSGEDVFPEFCKNTQQPDHHLSFSSIAAIARLVEEEDAR